jgi:hypothetical protein
VSASAALTVSAAEVLSGVLVCFCSSAASTITFAIIRANTESGEPPFPFPGVAMRRAALGAIGVTADSAAGVANDRGSPCGVFGSGTDRGETRRPPGTACLGWSFSDTVGDRLERRDPRRVSTEPGVARATASATAAVGDTPSFSHASRAAFPGEGPGPGPNEALNAAGISAVGVGSEGSIVPGESISDFPISEDEILGDSLQASTEEDLTATRAGGVPSTVADATLAVRESADALAPGDLGGLDLGLAVNDARTDS